VRLGRADEARAAFTAASERFPESTRTPEALLQAGRIALDARLYDEAVQLFKRAEAARPGSAAVDMGVALRKCGRAPESREILAREVERLSAAPSTPSGDLRLARLEMALTEAALGCHQAAEGVLEEVIRGGEDEISARAQHALAGICLKRGDYRAADRAFYQLLLLYRQESWQAEARFRLGQTNEQLRDFDRARRFYRELVRENPKSEYAERARERLKALGPGI
jgi:TolA-binding protein